MIANPYAPYALDAEERIRASARHIVSATAHVDGMDPVDLDVEDASIEFDDSRAPRIQGTLTCKLPAADVLEAFDARKTFRIRVHAGYKYDSVTQDVHLLADLHVRDRQVKRPANRVVFQVWSDEGLAMDYKRLAWDSQPPQSNLLDAVKYHVLIASIGSEVPPVLTDYPNEYGAAAVAGLVQEPGQSGWAMLAETAARAGVSIYCEPDRTWRIARPQALASTTSLNFTTGGGGLIIESNSVYSRDNFRNAVCIKYSWRDAGGADHVIWGHAYIGSGEFSVGEIGYNSHYEERDKPATQAQADQAAQNVLVALARRGRSFVLDAPSAYWLRPGMTITATLPEGDQERLLVSAVYFNFPSGSMSVRLRQPEDLPISSN